MKIVFLDIDGVLNSHAYSVERNLADPTHEMRAGFLPKNPRFWAPMIDKKAMPRLNKIIAETDAKIVISSSWRHANPAKKMQTILELAGFVGEVIDQTPVMEGPRSWEISSWLAANATAKRFVILDDGKSAGEGLEKWFIHTDLSHGLQDEHVARAIILLGRK
jgi:hypothetical protein